MPTIQRTSVPTFMSLKTLKRLKKEPLARLVAFDAGFQSEAGIHHVLV
jgi:hypothetical protein